MENKQDYNLARVLKRELQKRNNPKDLKSIHIGTVTNIEPVTVTIYENKVTLTENDDLYISEWFRFRCNIDKTKALSEQVPEKLQDSENYCEQAKEIKETHSANGSPCAMPDAISLLANAINSTNSAINLTNSELLALKCDLKIGDYVTIGSLEQLDRYILLDKVLSSDVS